MSQMGIRCQKTIVAAVGKPSASYRSRARSVVDKPHQVKGKMAALVSPWMTLLSNMSDTTYGLSVSPHDRLERIMALESPVMRCLSSR
jgi:hypothetical protein